MKTLLLGVVLAIVVSNTVHASSDRQSVRLCVSESSCVVIEIPVGDVIPTINIGNMGSGQGQGQRPPEENANSLHPPPMAARTQGQCTAERVSQFEYHATSVYLNRGVI